MFLIRSAFWICALIIALPLVTGGVGPRPSDLEDRPVEFGEVLYMVRTVTSDVMGLCDREPGACETARRGAWTARDKATELADSAHAWLSEAPRDGN